MGRNFVQQNQTHRKLDIATNVAVCFLIFLACLGVGLGCRRIDGERPTSKGSSGRNDVAQQSEEPTLTDGNAYAKRAYDWLCKDNHDQALKDYDQAIKLQPDHAAFWNARGFTWHMKGISDKDQAECEDHAISDHAEAIRLNSEYASAIHNRAWLRATTKVDEQLDGIGPPIKNGTSPPTDRRRVDRGHARVVDRGHDAGRGQSRRQRCHRDATRYLVGTAPAGCSRGD